MPGGLPNLEQLNQTLLAISAQNQTAINHPIETQISQKEAFTSMATAKKKRGYDLDFASIPTFDQKDKTKFHEWFRCIQQTGTYSNRNLHKEFLCKSACAVTTLPLKMNTMDKAEKIKKVL